MSIETLSTSQPCTCGCAPAPATTETCGCNADVPSTEMCGCNPTPGTAPQSNAAPCGCGDTGITP